jgi:hypothetical protein
MINMPSAMNSWHEIAVRFATTIASDFRQIGDGHKSATEGPLAGHRIPATDLIRLNECHGDGEVVGESVLPAAVGDTIGSGVAGIDGVKPMVGYEPRHEQWVALSTGRRVPAPALNRKP